jgi:hypothetical protein
LTRYAFWSSAVSVASSFLNKVVAESKLEPFVDVIVSLRVQWETVIELDACSSTQSEGNAQAGRASHIVGVQSWTIAAIVEGVGTEQLTELAKVAAEGQGTPQMEAGGPISLEMRNQINKRGKLFHSVILTFTPVGTPSSCGPAPAYLKPRNDSGPPGKKR